MLSTSRVVLTFLLSCTSIFAYAHSLPLDEPQNSRISRISSDVDLSTPHPPASALAGYCTGHRFVCPWIPSRDECIGHGCVWTCRTNYGNVSE